MAERKDIEMDSLGLVFHVRAPVTVRDVVLLTQLHANPEKAANDGPGAWVPATHVEKLIGVLGSWGPGSTLTLTLTCGRHLGMNRPSFSLSLPFKPFLKQKRKRLF